MLDTSLLFESSSQSNVEKKSDSLVILNIFDPTQVFYLFKESNIFDKYFVFSILANPGIFSRR